jgi:hypothetical protein
MVHTTDNNDFGAITKGVEDVQEMLCSIVGGNNVRGDRQRGG